MATCPNTAARPRSRVAWPPPTPTPCSPATHPRPGKRSYINKPLLQVNTKQSEIPFRKPPIQQKQFSSTVLLLIGPKRCHWISKRRIQLGSNAGFRSAGRLGKGTQDIGHPSSSVVRARNHQHTQQVQVGVHFFQGQQPHICSFLPPHKHCSSFTPCLCGHTLTQNCVVTFLTLNFNHLKTVFCFLFKLHRLDRSGLVSGNSNAGNSTRESMITLSRERKLALLAEEPNLSFNLILFIH